MTPERMQREEQHGALTAVAHALTAAEREQFLARTLRWPGMDGADVADILDMTVNSDQFLNLTEPFFLQYDDQLPDEVNYAAAYAAHALIILDRPLTLPALLALLERAGVIDAPDDKPAAPGAVAAELAEVLMSGFGVLDEPAARLVAADAIAVLRAIRDRDGTDPLGASGE
jgi:hypothetical protein